MANSGHQDTGSAAEAVRPPAESSRLGTMLLCVLALLLDVAPAGTGPEPEVYYAAQAEFVTKAYTARGYEVRARVRYPFPLQEVLDATHDHRHLAERDPDIESAEARITACSRELCRINVAVLVGRFFPVGDVAYELVTDVTRTEDEVTITWDKAAGTRFVKHLHGELRLSAADGGAATEVDYRIQVAAPRLSTEKLAAKAVAYLERLGTVARERHDGRESLWSRMEEAQADGRAE